MCPRTSEPPEPRRLRFRRAAAVLVGSFCVLFLGVAKLQLLETARYRELAEKNWLRLEILRAPRGRIFDSGGVLLADNAPALNVVFRPPPVGSHQPDTLTAAAAALLGSLLGLPDSLVRQGVAVAGASGLPCALRRDAPLDVVVRVEERLAELPGVEVQIEPRRAYPESTRAAHLLGYAGEISQTELDSLAERGYRRGDLIGRAGLERSYEKELRGEDGGKVLVVNASGRRVSLYRDLDPVAPRPGRDLVLTVDLRVQRALERAMASVAAGGAVAIDPRTGGVLALVSRPSFDPNEFARGLSRQRWQELTTDPSHPLLDRAIQSAYPPGSTFKVVTSLAGLADGVLDENTHFRPCVGGYAYGGRFFRCWQHSGHGSLALVDALANSCDVYFYQVGLRLGVKRLGEMARRLLLGERSGVDLPQERRGLVPTPEWYAARGRRAGGGTVMNLAIGQGELLVTPLQLASLAATVASRGQVVRPHLVRAVRDPETGAERAVRPGAVRRVEVPAADWEWVVGAMEKAVSAGTGGRARVPGVRVAGKTGTAQNPHGQDHALFIAFAPVEAPTVALAVVVENGGHGGSVAAPIAREAILARLWPDSVFVARAAGPATGAAAATGADSAAADSLAAEGD